MKNLIFLFLTFFVLNSFKNKEESIVVRAWWKTAIVDAAGALGGAGSVASLGGLACPPCLGAGAILGGAGASLAMVAPPEGTIALQDLNTRYEFAKNSNDNVGINHNDIIKGFVQSRRTFSAKNYVNYIKGLNNKEYNDALKVIDTKYLDAEFKIIRRIKTEADALGLVKSRLPKGIDSKMLISDLENAMNAQTSKEFVTEIKAMELNNYSKDGKINKIDKLILNSFFSTLRYSTALWGK